MTKTAKSFLATAVTASGLLLAPMLHAQQTASIEGHTNDEIGMPVKDAQVVITPPNVDPTKTKPLYSFPVDATGNYKGSGIAPGSYVVSFMAGGKLLDYQPNQDFKAGATLTENFDLSRPEYIAKESPERRKEIEEYKAKNAAAMSGNKQIANLNATMQAVRTDLHSANPNFDKDVADSKAATDALPTEPLLWVLYGDALSGQADHAAAVDRANKTNPSQDDAVTKGYSSAVDAYQKAVDLINSAPKKPAVDVQATVYNQLGNTLAKAGKMPEATAAYDKAAALQPQDAGMYYGNEAAVFYNAHQEDPALAAAEKAIAADPNKPLPYFIKGQVLLGKSSVDSKTGKISPPPGCIEAYQKYLELAPDGPQAPAVKDSLTALGQTIQTHYSARKGH